MRAIEFIFEANMPKPMNVPEPKAIDPKSATKPEQVQDLISQMVDVAEKPVPSMKETKNKNKK